MKLQKYIPAVLACTILLSVSSCEKFEEYNTDPNQPSKVTSGMLATNVLLDLMQNTNPKSFIRHNLLSKYLSWTEGNDIDYFWNKLGRYSFGTATTLYNVEKMIELAPEVTADSYKGLGHILRAWKFFDMTMRVGDMPYSEAMLGETGIEYPAYDSQETIFIGLLNELEQADALLQNGAPFTGDFVYDGDVNQWRKVANVLELKLLINLYRKTDNQSLKVKERFQNIVSNKPLFESNADNWQLVHSDKAGQKYPFNEDGNTYIEYAYSSSIVLDSLKKYQDRRLFYYAEPTINAVAAGKSASDWDSYKGTDPTNTFEVTQLAVQSGEVSPLNVRYHKVIECEPTFILSYCEMNFILAEAVVRGLISGDAKAYYEEGIRAAMKFTAENTPDNAAYHHDMKITDEYIEEYLKGKDVAFGSTTERQIAQIIEQKYLATFMQAPYSSFYEYRRTGYPVLPINPNSNLNTPADKMPVRWMYSQDEYDYNTENVKAAVQEQFNGVDDENQIMWILK